MGHVFSQARTFKRLAMQFYAFVTAVIAFPEAVNEYCTQNGFAAKKRTREKKVTFLRRFPSVRKVGKKDY